MVVCWKICEEISKFCLWDGGKPLMAAVVSGVCVELKNNTFLKRCVRFVTVLLFGEKSGLPFGMRLNTAATAAEQKKQATHECFDHFSASALQKNAGGSFW
jgi:hypothetical protein